MLITGMVKMRLERSVAWLLQFCITCLHHLRNWFLITQLFNSSSEGSYIIEFLMIKYWKFIYFYLTMNNWFLAITFFFFWIWGNFTFPKAYFVGPDKRAKPRLFQNFTRNARPDSNSNHHFRDVSRNNADSLETSSTKEEEINPNVVDFSPLETCKKMQTS